MLGSSKSLARALSNVYEKWETNFDWINSPSNEIKEVFLVIDAYIKKRASASAGLNESLKAIHDTYIRSFESISKELFFLEVLIRLVPVLNQDHIKLLLHTYLRPALDSAGFDLVFVEKSRLFLKRIVEESSSLIEQAIPSRVETNSSLVIDSILNIYLGGEKCTGNLLAFESASANVDSTYHNERNLFIDQNASMLLKEMAQKSPLVYFNLLDKYFCVPSTRQKACLLLCQVLSTNGSQIKCITSSSLFASLIRCLSFDFNLSIISSALLALLIIIGKISESLARYLPELFYIFGRLSTHKRYARFVNLREMTMTQLLVDFNINWSIASHDNNSLAFKSFLNKDGNFDTLYLLSVLYGLFPLNVLDYAKLPIKYFQSSNPTIIPLHFLTQLEESFLLPIYTYIGERARGFLRKAIIHPNIINRVTSAEELNDPIRWIRVENDGKDMGEDEILSACLKLNPDIFLSVSDNSALSRIVGDAELVSRVLSEFEKVLFPLPKERKLIGSSLPSSRQSIGLAQSDGEKSSQGLRLDLSLPFSPKLPSIPFNDNLPSSNGGEDISSVQFKKIDFAGRSSIGLELELEDDCKRNSVSSLFSAHEKLNNDKVQVNTNNPLNTDVNHFATGSIQLALKGASDLLSKQLKRDAKVSKISREGSVTTCIAGEDVIEAGQSQKSIEFYERQILLLQNEVEFLNFVKRLNMLNYMRLKHQINEMIRKSASKLIAEDDDLLVAYNDLLSTVKSIEKEKASELSRKNEELTLLKTRVEELKRRLEEMLQKYSDSEANLAISRQIIIKVELDGATRDLELEELKAKSKLAENNNAGASLHSKDENREKELSAALEQVYLDDKSKKAFDMEIEVNALRESNKRIATELERSQDSFAYNVQSYEKKIEAMKHDLGEQMRKSMDGYEQKIRELNLVIVKFETLLEEKNALIMQLSTSRPILIPSISDPRVETPEKPIFRSENSGSKTTIDYFSHLPSAPVAPNAYKPSNSASRQSSTQSFPIIKGRGGYQKRVKKIM